MKAHELLSNPTKWTKCDYAKDSEGWPVLSRDEDAVCWCVNGALTRCYSDPIIRDDIRRKIAMRIDPDGKDKPHDAIVKWNDAVGRTFEEVHSLLKELDV